MSLDRIQIEALLKKDKEKPAKTGGTRKDRTAERSYENWFKQKQHFGDCEFPDCTDPRPKRAGTTMVVEVKGVKLCRYCFLAGVNAN